jgi:hypothetical protein
MQPSFPSGPKPLRDFLQYLEEHDHVTVTIANHTFQRRSTEYDINPKEAPCVFKLTQKVTKRMKLTHTNLGAALAWDKVKASRHVLMVLHMK